MAKTKAVKVEVTKTDIRLGKRGDICTCAVARAARRALKTAKCGWDFWLYGADTNISLVRTGKEKCWSNEEAGTVPAKCERFAQKFDDEKVPKPALKPLSFMLRLPN